MTPMTPAGWKPALVLGLITLVALSGCGGGGGGTSSPPVQSLSLGYYYQTASGLLPIAATVGDSVQLLCAGNVSGGQVSLTQKATWHSDSDTVASVAADGTLTARTPGTAHITATYKALTSDPLTVTVSAAGATPTASLYPFRAGNQWVYTGTEVGPTAAAPQVVLTITTERQVVLEGLVWWELQINYTDPDTPPGFMYLRHDDRGLREVYYLRVGESDIPQYSYRLQEPLTAGAHWVDPARPEHYWDLLATTASVTVPAGTYANCFQVREHEVADYGGSIGLVPFTVTTWFAPSLGPVSTVADAPTYPTANSYQNLLRSDVTP